MVKDVRRIIIPEDAKDYDTLYKKADAALYVTKETGRNGTTVYSDDEMKTYR